MIYSDEINRVCGLCEYAQVTDMEDEIYCEKKRKKLTVSTEACRKFKYDIFKRSSHRRRRKLKTYSQADFELI